MPKIKTHKGAKRRFKITGTGKIKRQSSHARHRFTGKSAKRKRNLERPKLVHKSDEKRVRMLLPYS